MADSTKYMPINGGTLVSDLKLKNLFSFRTKRTRAFAYVFISIFIGFSLFVAFNPSDPSSPWFSNIFSGTNIIIPLSSSNSTSIQANGTTRSSPSSSDSNASGKSKLSSFYSSIFSSNSSQSIQNSTINSSNSSQSIQNPNRSIDLHDKFEDLKLNQTLKTVVNASSEIIPKPISKSPKSMAKNTTKTQESAPTNVTKNGDDQKIGKKSSLAEELVKKLSNCNLFDGEWVRDESYPLYKAGSCSLIDEQFNCFSNGRPDNGYQKLKWKPKGCSLPRLDGSHMLQLLRGKRLVFVGDSLNRNMWESLVCILRNSVKNQTAVYEASGRQHFRSEPSYSFVFKDYDCTIEFFVAPFIVREWEIKEKNKTKETLRLDLIGSSADQYKNADIVVFNTGHWWTHDKTAKGQDYYQEGSHVYSELNVLEAFRKAMTTWGRWVDANINPRKTSVFFRGYSASHFSGGQWNSGGACDNEIEPIKNTTYLTPYPDKMMVLEKVLRGMKTRVSYLNVTRLTDFRKDGHPSIYRKQHYTEEERKSPLHYQDCSHWCLPGVPDAWNEILYAQLLSKQYQNQQQKHKN